MYKQKTFSKLRGFTPIKLVLLILCSAAVFEVYNLFWVTETLSDLEATSRTPSLLSALKFGLFAVGAYFCFRTIGRIKARLQYYHEHNAMTGLPNRNFFNRHLKNRLVEAIKKNRSMP